MTPKDVEPRISLSEVRRSIKDEIYRVPLVNEVGDRIFVAETKMTKDHIILTLENDQQFFLKVTVTEA